MNVDRAYFERDALTAAQAKQIRANLIKRIQATKLYGWNKDRDELSVTMYLAPARDNRLQRSRLQTVEVLSADILHREGRCLSSAA